MDRPDLEASFPAWGTPLHVILTPHRRGRGDPAWRRDDDGTVWLALRAPLEGTPPATLALREMAGSVLARAWGPGAAWAVAATPDLLGRSDDPSPFRPHHPLVADAWRRHPRLRLGRTGRLWEALLPAVLEQRVTGVEARRAWRGLLLRHGEPAPASGPGGPAPEGMRVPPTPVAVRSVPDWEWHRLAVDLRRRSTLRAAATLVSSVADAATADVATRLRTIPGVGRWTVAETVQRASGDPDEVSVGDYHLASFVGWALVGRPVDDAGMLALLEPYRGQRQRAVRLLEVSGFRAPRRGPRMPVQDMRAW